MALKTRRGNEFVLISDIGAGRMLGVEVEAGTQVMGQIQIWAATKNAEGVYSFLGNRYTVSPVPMVATELDLVEAG